MKMTTQYSSFVLLKTNHYTSMMRCGEGKYQRQISYKCLTHCWRCFGELIDWEVLAGPDLWRRMLLKGSIIMAFTCPLLSWCKSSSPFRENNNVIVFPFPFHIFRQLANLRFTRSCALRKSRCNGRLRILIPGFIRSPRKLTVYGY